MDLWEKPKPLYYYCHKPDCYNSGPFLNAFVAIEHAWFHNKNYLVDSAMWRCTKCANLFCTVNAADEHTQCHEEHNFVHYSGLNFAKFRLDRHAERERVRLNRLEDIVEFGEYLEKFIKLTPSTREDDLPPVVSDRHAPNEGFDVKLDCHYQGCALGKKMGIMEGIEHLSNHMDYHKDITAIKCHGCTEKFHFWLFANEHFEKTGHEIQPKNEGQETRIPIMKDFLKAIETFLRVEGLTSEENGVTEDKKPVGMPVFARREASKLQNWKPKSHPLFKNKRPNAAPIRESQKKKKTK